MKPRTLYILAALACIAGYVWTLYSIHSEKAGGDFSPCPFRNITGLPCPGCGTTRSVGALTRGDFTEAWHFNPMGYAAAAVLIILPFWLLHDAVRRTDTLYRGYLLSEEWLRHKTVVIILFLLIAANWTWNFFKY